jgi:hypothetical protein
MQLVDTDAPVVARYKPDAQAVHEVEAASPVDVVYNPMGQPVHEEVALPVDIE